MALPPNPFRPRPPGFQADFGIEDWDDPDDNIKPERCMNCVMLSAEVGVTTPEKCLCLAILERSMLDLRMEDHRVRTTAAQWVFDEDRKHFHSFHRVLESLGIETRAEQIRNKAKELIKEGQAKYQSRCGSARKEEEN